MSEQMKGVLNRTAIAFYCKGCLVLFFAVVNEPKYLAQVVSDIAGFLIAEHRIQEIPIEAARAQLGSCICGGVEVKDAQEIEAIMAPYETCPSATRVTVGGDGEGE